MAKEVLEYIIEYKIDNFDYITLKSFCTNKTNEKIRREAINWRGGGGNLHLRILKKDLISKIYRKLIQIYKNSSHSLLDKWQKDMNRQFSDKEIETISSHMKRCSKSILIREMQIKATLRYLYTLLRLVNMTGKNNDECWRGCGKTGTLTYCWWNCEQIQPFWRAIWNYAQRTIKL
uniref:Uncharacterized protein n=1 Tax=Sarcophilus harrisii TaxID=9305 RepID=A0A7N4PKT2_SARHA